MADYFLLHAGDAFEQHLRPALATARRQRSFAAAVPLCRSLLSRVEEFDRRYHIGEGEPLIRQVAEGLPYHRDFWRALVGELLFYAAEEIPEVSTCPATLAQLVGFGEAIGQVHRGSRPLTFGLAVYRPEQCGYNDRDDVRRLATYLDSLDPAFWKDEHLTELPEEDREEELAIAREWFPPLHEMYRRAANAEQVIVHEIL
jgi:hypothetical protein